ADLAVAGREDRVGGLVAQAAVVRGVLPLGAAGRRAVAERARFANRAAQAQARIVGVPARIGVAGVEVRRARGAAQRHRDGEADDGVLAAGGVRPAVGSAAEAFQRALRGQAVVRRAESVAVAHAEAGGALTAVPVIAAAADQE